MKAVQVSKTGGPEVLQISELPVPQPKPNEALVELKAIGINFIDVYFREGVYPAKLPFVDGQEASGVVKEVGSEVKSLKSGMAVAYTGVLGAYAQYAAVPADKLVAIPEGLDFNVAAALMLQGMTAHYLVKSTYPVKKGDWCLIHAAAGGVGQLLVQLCKMLGANVIATAGSDEKVKIAKQAGADYAINYATQNFEDEVKRITSGAGVNVVYDGVGKATFDAGMNCLRPRGLFVLFGAASGAVPPLDLQRLNQRGSIFITRPSLAHHIASREELEWRAGEVMNWVKTGALKISIGHTYPLDQVQQAHRDLEARKTTGKLLLIP